MVILEKLLTINLLTIGLSFTFKDLITLLIFLAGLITTYIKHRISFKEFETKVNINLKMQENRIDIMEKTLKERKEVEQELLLEGRETKVLLTIINDNIKTIHNKVDKLEDSLSDIYKNKKI